MFIIKKGRLKPARFVLNSRWAGGSLTRKPKVHIAVSWLRQLVKMIITIPVYSLSPLLVRALIHSCFYILRASYNNLRKVDLEPKSS